MKREYNLKRAIVLLSLIMLVETAGIVLILIYAFASDKVGLNEYEFALLFFLTLIAITGSMITILSLRPLVKLSMKLRQTERSIINLEDLNNTLRAQRHDFMNHLQVVYTLVELEEFTEAQGYLEKVYQDIQKVSRVLKTGKPAVNAILQAKVMMCEARGIAAEVEVRSTLADIILPEWELCQVLGNIIDNSVNALMELQPGIAKRIKVEIFEDLKNHCFKISNNGPPIHPSLWEKIFEAGFTTRVKGGEGMGLAICRRIISSYGGELRVYSNDNKTVFEGKVPRSSDV